MQSIATANQASQAFDNITYDKGAAVITMLKDEIGDDPFRTGVQRYMRAHAFGNTVDADFWSLMQRAAGKPILTIEHDFTAQEGLPLVRVTHGANGIRLNEDRFTSAGPQTASNTQRWHLPLNIASVGTGEQRIVLEGTSSVTNASPPLVNAGQKGFARVLYSEADFAALLTRVPALAPVDQIGLMQDAAAFGMAGYAPASRALAVASSVPPGAEPIVWQRIAGMISGIDRAYAEAPARAEFRRYAVALLKPALATLGAEAHPSEGANVPIVRTALTEALGSFGDPDTVARARALVERNGGSPAELRTALNVTAAKADPTLFDALLARARSTKDPLAKMRIYQALAGVENSALARRMADIVLSDEVPAGTNVGLMYPLAAAHPDLAWSLLVPGLATPAAGIEKTTQWRVAAAIAGLSADETRMGQFQSYIDANVPLDARAPMQGAFASIRQRHRVAAQVLPELNKWIAER